MTKQYFCLLLLSLCSFSSHAAKEFQFDDESYLRLSAFGTFGLNASSIERNDYILTRDKKDSSGIGQGQLPFLADSRLGVQMDAILNPQFSAVVQFLVKDRVEQDLNTALQWAFVKYQPNAAWQIRGGRMGVDSFMLSDQRNVGFTYLWVRPPIEFYGTFPIYNYDGGDVRYRMPFFDGNLDFKVFAGTSSNIIPVENGGYFDNSLTPISGANLVFSNHTWQARISYVFVTFEEELIGLDKLQSALNLTAPFYPDATRLSNGFKTKEKSAHYISAGIAYEHDDWQIQSELAHAIVETPAVPSFYNGYFSVGHHFGELTPYAMYSRVGTSHQMKNASPSPIPQVRALIDVTNEALDHLRQNQETFSVGTRWDFYENMALKLQYDRTHVINNSYGLWFENTNNSNQQTNDSYNVFSLTFDFVY
jgi:hypothetical protein